MPAIPSLDSLRQYGCAVMLSRPEKDGKPPFLVNGVSRRAEEFLPALSGRAIPISVLNNYKGLTALSASARSQI